MTSILNVIRYVPKHIALSVAFAAAVLTSVSAFAAPEVKIEVLIVKATTVDGKKIAKDTIIEIEEKAAKKLIDSGNAELVPE